MDKETLNFTIEKTHELMDAFSCCSEAKAAAQAWLDAIGTDAQAEETVKYISEIEEDIMPIDTLISFADSDAGAQVFGDHAADVAAHAREIKAAGAKYCDCPACKAIEEILEKKELLLQ